MCIRDRAHIIQNFTESPINVWCDYHADTNNKDPNTEFQEFITKYCWGEIWTKTILSNKQRSMNNLCMLSALNKWQEFSIHFRGAIKNGCTLLELKDVLLQITVYCGVPCGVEAFRHARKVLEEDGIDIEKEFSKND